MVVVPFRFVHACAIVALGLVVSGCTGDAGALDRRDENHPLVRRAIAAKRSNDVDGAIDLLYKALEKRPDLARAHLELALIYDQEPKENFVRAIYHYERYLEMRPETQAREQVEKLVKRARLSYAASLPDQPSEAVRMIADLQRQVEMLRIEIAKQQEGARGVSPSPAPGAVAPRAGGPARAVPGAPLATSVLARAAATTNALSRGLSAPTPAPASAVAQTYKVQSGDTLSTIASKVYNDRQAWRKIYDANRSVLSGTESVRPGQVLVIPPP